MTAFNAVVQPKTINHRPTKHDIITRLIRNRVLPSKRFDGLN